MTGSTHDRGVRMERCATAGTAVGRGFDRKARDACHAFRAEISYLGRDTKLLLYVIPSYPAHIAIRRDLPPDVENLALATALGHILAFHDGREDYHYAPEFIPGWKPDAEYIEAKVFAEAFCRGTSEQV